MKDENSQHTYMYMHGTGDKYQKGTSSQKKVDNNGEPGQYTQLWAGKEEGELGAFY